MPLPDQVEKVEKTVAATQVGLINSVMTNDKYQKWKHMTTFWRWVIEPYQLTILIVVFSAAQDKLSEEETPEPEGERWWRLKRGEGGSFLPWKVQQKPQQQQQQFIS